MLWIKDDLSAAEKKYLKNGSYKVKMLKSLTSDVHVTIKTFPVGVVITSIKVQFLCKLYILCDNWLINLEVMV